MAVLVATQGLPMAVTPVPVISPATGLYAVPQSVTITDSAATATIYYTLDGATPTTSSMVYAGTFTVSTSQTVQAIAKAPGMSASGVATSSIVISAATTLYLGANLGGVNYYNSEQPWLNLFHGAGSNGNGGNSFWFTGSSTIFDTGEENWLQTDSNGFVTSLTASNGGVGNGNGSGGNQQFTKIFTLMNFNLNNQDQTGYANGVPPGAVSLYQQTTYYFQFQGAWTGTFGGDATNLAQVSGSVSVSGNTITSTLGQNATGIVSFQVVTATTAGLNFTVTVIPSSTNYPRALVCTPMTQLASYNSGERFSPLFTSYLTAVGYSRFRFMDWLSTNFQAVMIGFSQALSTGATSAILGNAAPSGGSWSVGFSFATTLSSGASNVALSTAWTGATGTICFVTSASQSITMSVTKGSTTTSSWSAVVGTAASTQATTWLWQYPTGTYQFVLGNNASEAADAPQLVTATMTNLGGQVAFASALTAPVSYYFAYGASTISGYTPQYNGWANRPIPTQMSYCGGVPYELCFALCEQLGIDAWITIPLWANQYQGQSGFWTSLASLIKTTIQGGFTGKVVVELGNEIWNTGKFPQNNLLGVIGYAQFGSSQNFTYSQQEYMGTQVAGICDAFKAVLGTTVFNGQIIVSMGGQFAPGNGSAFLDKAMNTQEWTSRAYTHGVGAYHYAPYMTTVPVSSNDYTTLLATANPVNALFDLAYSNRDRYGNTYNSVPTNGFIGGAITTTTTIRTALSGEAWYSLPMLGYEAGQGFDNAYNGTNAWVETFEKANRDVRMGYCYYDPTHQLTSNNGYLPAMITAGFKSINQFGSCGAYSQYGAWGARESVMQSTSPAKEAAITLWIAS